jgi:hypothetical protein
MVAIRWNILLFLLGQPLATEIFADPGKKQGRHLWFASRNPFHRRPGCQTDSACRRSLHNGNWHSRWLSRQAAAPCLDDWPKAPLRQIWIGRFPILPENPQPPCWC